MLTPKLIITGYNLLLFDTVPCYVIFLIYLMQALTIHRLSWSLSTKIIVFTYKFWGHKAKLFVEESFLFFYLLHSKLTTSPFLRSINIASSSAILIIFSWCYIPQLIKRNFLLLFSSCTKSSLVPLHLLIVCSHI